MSLPRWTTHVFFYVLFLPASAVQNKNKPTLFQIIRCGNLVSSCLISKGLGGGYRKLCTQHKPFHNMNYPPWLKPENWKTYFTLFIKKEFPAFQV